MTAADWLIIAVVLLITIAAAFRGFFEELLSMAGLVIGYIVAAWQYPGLAAWFSTFLKNDLLADIFAFLVIFFCDLDPVQHCWQVRTQVDESGRAERV